MDKPEEIYQGLKFFTYMKFLIPDEIPANSGVIRLPKNPSEWAKALKKDTETGGNICLTSTLARGCGGCFFGFAPDRSSVENTDSGQVFSFVLSREKMLAFQRMINIAVEEMEH